MNWEVKWIVDKRILIYCPYEYYYQTDWIKKQVLKIDGLFKRSIPRTEEIIKKELGCKSVSINKDGITTEVSIDGVQGEKVKPTLEYERAKLVLIT